MKTTVSLVECREYEYGQLKQSIAESFQQLGGIGRYIAAEDKVLLKMNLLMKKRPEEATTTHPLFVKALAETLLEYGADVIIGDSPGGPFNEKMLKGIYKYCGITNVVEELAEAQGYGTRIQLNYNTNHMNVDNPDGLLLKHLTVTEMLLDVDKVISVSKLKTHGMTMFTGAVKNMFGIIPGMLKAEYHFKMPELDDFCNALVDICAYGNPVLSFMDGIVGMEGAGPSAGNPRNIGAVIASTSPYHLDVVASSLINLNPLDVPTIKLSSLRGLCTGTLTDIDVQGKSIEHFLIKDFDIPPIRQVTLFMKNTPKFLQPILNSMLQPKPIFDHSMCVGCNVCAEHCPADVISMVDKRPIVDLNPCIRCFCCQELCPKKAVTIHRPWLMRKIAKW
ncbi:DUF362 domain-containing protein [Desulfuribacillus alkaliarsenatis]|uniref:Iron-sulfur protein n=1 Tax=Desulfuribacillus alkaliarsenatis TaxID=766136 RepID=A0A1E5G371_9FIRM|nr:DUF362 domain-containing protein [Desulfuribacillus alkaliarsenatis]OEF97522.1 iron-sulfur protein [Desulfuribacillus alkaliarsenatis]